MKLEKGMQITSKRWKGILEIVDIEDKDKDRVIIRGRLLESGMFKAIVFNKDTLCQAINIEDSALTFTGSGYKAFLSAEMLRYRFASEYDPLLAVNVSKIEPLPFQIEAVYGKILKLPRIRFLIADDPGAGKTIMTGLVVKELKLRGLINRTLIVVPGHLKDQWRREMTEKFDENFLVIDRTTFNNVYKENPWERYNQVITSIDFAKQDEILNTLKATHWDLIVVDEAHKMAAYRYGNKTEKTQRYRLGEVLSKISTHFLTLTATPHRGDPDNFKLFLDLLQPDFYATTEQMEQATKNDENPLYIRRLKEDLKDFDGKPIFPPRHPRTLEFKLSDTEYDLYSALSQYVREQYRIASEKEKRPNVTFALIILQRRMASSTYALMQSLIRRKNRLQELLKETRSLPEDKLFWETDQIEEYDDYDEQQRTKIEEKWETLSVARNKEELRGEIGTLEGLISQAKEIVKSESEVKISELRGAIEKGFERIKQTGGNEKILIFTESRDTLGYLVNKIRSWGYKVNSIHGGMNLEERIRQEGIFRNETQIMVATEAAGEGINLQFCNIMINYDIPWNPNRLEQRMGRIHRYGQTREVFIFNLVASNTAEGRVLLKLLEKLNQIREALGTDRTFDVIGEIFQGKNLYQMIVDAATRARSIDEIINELEISVDSAEMERLKKQVLGESLATRHIDYTRIKEQAEKARENKLIPEYVEEFFIRAMNIIGGKSRVKRIKDSVLSIRNVPFEIRNIASEEEFRNKFGSMSKHYAKITFDKDIAKRDASIEYIAFGHPLLEAVLEYVRRNFLTDLKKGAVFKDPSGKLDGIIWMYESVITDGCNEIAGKKLITIYDDGKSLSSVSPAILWDLIPIDNTDSILTKPNSEVKNHAIILAENYLSELLQERLRQANIKEKYGIKSLKTLIMKYDSEIIEYQNRSMKGERVESHLRRAEDQKNLCRKRLQELEDRIERERELNIEEPTFIGAIKVIPDLQDLTMSSDEEIEKIGMELAIRYERENGRIPEDVSAENLGFDIRSKDPETEQVRYIEVKARAAEGSVVLTPNEWLKAKRFRKQYWLYIVANAGTTSPSLHIINDPVNSLQPEEKLEVVRYIVYPDDWKNHSIKENI